MKALTNETKMGREYEMMCCWLMSVVGDGFEVISLYRFSYPQMRRIVVLHSTRLIDLVSSTRLERY